MTARAGWTWEQRALARLLELEVAERPSRGEREERDALREQVFRVLFPDEVAVPV